MVGTTFAVIVISIWINNANKMVLTHLRLVSHICVSELGQRWYRWWLVALSVPSHYLNQCWAIFNLTIWIEIQIFSFLKMHLKMSPAYLAVILCRGRWVKMYWQERCLFAHNAGFIAKGQQYTDMHNIPIYTIQGVSKQNWLYENIMTTLLIFQNTTIRIYGAWV